MKNRSYSSKSCTFAKSAVLFASALLLAILFSVTINADPIVGPEDPFDPGIVTPGGETTVTRSGSCGENLTWKLDLIMFNNTALDGFLTISGSGAMPDYQIVDYPIEEARITNIERPWDDYAGIISSLVIEDGVTYIGQRAFSDLTALKSVKFGKDIAQIPSNAFYNNMSLRSIVVNSRITSSPSLISEGYGDFRLFCNTYGSVPDLSVTFGDGLLSVVSTVEDFAALLNELQLCFMPAVSSINADIFSDICTFVDGVLYSKNGETLICYLSGKTDTSYTVPNNVKAIKQKAFTNCKYLVNIIFGDNVEAVERAAFYNCSVLASVNVGDSPVLLSPNCFLLCNALNTIGGKCGQALQWSLDASNIGLTASVRYLSLIVGETGDAHMYAYQTDDSDEKHNLTPWHHFKRDFTRLSVSSKNNNPTSISAEAFKNCAALNEISFGSANITSIGADAFANCSAISWLLLPENSVFSVADGAFDGCAGLKKIHLGSFTGSLEGFDFDNYPQLEKIYVSDSNAAYRGVDGVLYRNVNYGGGAIDPGSGVVVFESFRLCRVPCGRKLPLTLPEYVTGIEPSAMNNCNMLTEINVSDDNTAYCSIDGVVFSKNTERLVRYPARKNYSEDPTLLSVYTIPANVKFIDSGAFKGCLVKSIDNSGVIEQIDSGAFSDCPNLVRLLLNTDSLTLSDGAFGDCPKLEYVTIFGTLSLIDPALFDNCPMLTDVSSHMEDLVWRLYLDDGKLEFNGDAGMERFRTEDGSLMWEGYKNIIKSVVIKNDVTDICDGAFAQYPALESVTIGTGVESIGYRAFSDCDMLTDVVIPDNVKTVGSEAFNNCDALTNMRIGDGVTTVGNNALLNTPLRSLHIGRSVTSITDIGIEWQYNLETLTVSEGNAAYYAADNVLFDADGALILYPIGKKDAAYTIPDGTTAILADAFSENRYLTDLTICDSVTSIAEYAFGILENLVTINIGGGVSSLTGNHFMNLTSLAAVNVSDSNASYRSVDGVPLSKDNARLICYPAAKKTEEYHVPQGVLSIDGYTFTNNTYLKKVFLPDGVASIGEYALAGCPALTDVYIPDSVTSIAASAFANSFPFFRCGDGSYAESYAKNNNFFFHTPANGVVEGEDGSRTCYVDGVQQFGWQQIYNDVYYFDPSDGGRAVSGDFVIDRTTYVFGDDGRFTGFIKYKNGDVKFTGGTLPAEGRFNRNWCALDGGIYYFVSSSGGVMATGERTIGGVTYTFGEDGAFTGWATYGDGTRRFYPDGIPQDTPYATGWQSIGGEVYYFLKANGDMVTGDKSIGGVTYAFGEDGAFNGWSENSVGAKRHYSGVIPQGRVYDTGWQSIDGNWYYFVSSNSGYMAVGDKTIGGVSYTFGEDGVYSGELKHGLVAEDGGLRYYKFNIPQTGWQNIGENRYYFLKASGLAVTANRFVGGVYCAFDENGVYRAPRNGFITEGGVTRYYKNDSHVTGWREIEGYWYYFYVKDGAMVTESRVIGGTWYEIAPDGKINTTEPIK